MPAYRVQLDLFAGPLDLLLYLVRRNEVDILDLPIAEITAQFVDYLEVLELIDLEVVGDFVATASQLVEIKSRLALPRPEEDEETGPEIGGDPRSELIQQLLEYKKYKDAARALEERAAEWQERYPRLSDDRPRTGKDPSADHIREVELWDLVSALSRVLRRKTVEQHARIRYDDTPISVYVERIGSRVRREGRVAFSALFDETRDRGRIVGMFLALLELLRHHDFRAEQPHDFGEIWITPPESTATVPPVPAHSAGSADS
jgi:segregation and condensation protein A